MKIHVYCQLVYFCLQCYVNFNSIRSFNLKEEKLRGRPGYEHLNESLHILIEADLPANIVDIRLRQAQEIIEELLKPVVFISNQILSSDHSLQFQFSNKERS